MAGAARNRLIVPPCKQPVEALSPHGMASRMLADTGEGYAGEIVDDVSPAAAAAGLRGLACGREQLREVGHRSIASGVDGRADAGVPQYTAKDRGNCVAFVEAVIRWRNTHDVVDQDAVLTLDAADLGRCLRDSGAESAATCRASCHGTKIGTDEDRLQLGTESQHAAGALEASQ